METLFDLFETFALHGSRPAVVHRTGVRRLAYGYDDLRLMSLKVASFLAERGVDRGDRVMIWAPNGPWWCALFWGAILRGAVVVPVDFMSDLQRARSILSLTGAKVVVQSRWKRPRLEDGADTLLIEELEQKVEKVPPLQSPARPAPDDLAELIYTSGTTGNPKGVMLTHRNLIANLLQVNRHLPIVTADFRFLSLLPLSHMFEQMGGFLTPLLNGASIIYIPTLKPSAIMEALAEEDVRAVILVPRLLQLLRNSIERRFAAQGLERLLQRLLDTAETLPFSLRTYLFGSVHRRFGRHFELFVSGGAPLDPGLKRFWSLMGFRVVEGYGLTECSPVLTADLPDRPSKTGVGRALPGVELKMEEGEILARGDNVFSGYYRNPEATRETFTFDGWFRTGDMGEIDEEGILHIRGRRKEMIVTGAGINVYPDDLEEVLNRQPGVREACVVGVRGGEGERVHAALLLDPGAPPPGEIVHNANAELDSLYRVTTFSVWPDPEFPKTTTMKVRKHLVRERIESGGREGGGAMPDRLADLVARVTGSDPGFVREDAYLVSDLGLTSIGRLELVTLMEQEFRLDLDDSLIGPQTRLADLRRMVAEHGHRPVPDHTRLWTSSRWCRFIRMAFDACVNYPLFRLFVRLEVRGLEHLEGLQPPVFFAANHVSYFDQPSIMFAFPRKWRYRTATAAWEEFFFVNYKGPFSRAWKRFSWEYGSLALNLFPLPQSDGFRRSLRFMGRLIDRSVNILIFPEGERSTDGRMHPFRPGLGMMVKELGIPVVPVALSGLERVFPRGARFPRAGKVMVTFGSPLIITESSVSDIVRHVERAVALLKENSDINFSA